MGQTPVPGLYGRAAIFIDGSNFYHTIRELELHVDYRRVLEYFGTYANIVRASYYTTLLEGEATPDWLIRLISWLSYNGYQVITKPARYFRRKFTGEDGGTYWVNEIKGDLDVEIAVDMLTYAPHCDVILLFSGDGGFVPVIKAIQEEGCRVIVISSEKTRDSSVADEVRRQADWFIDVASISEEIRRKDFDENSSLVRR